MKPFHKHFIAAFGLITVLAVAPTSAFARGSVHIDVPGFSIGIHDDHGYKHRKRHHRKYRKRYSNDRYYDDRRYRKRYYNNRRYNERRYKRRYNDNYYYSGRRNNRGYYNDRYRAEVCPTDGYSRYYDRNRNCYEHKGHYHCS